MISFQVEQLETCKDEIANLLEAHWDEVSLPADKDIIPMYCDWPAYHRMEDAGELHILTCRKDGKIIGYHVTICRTHLHYQTTLHGFVDVFFIHPDHRKGRAGIQLFIEAEKSLAKRGVVKLMSGTKTHLDVSVIFERLGWRSTETLYTKVIGRAGVQ